LLKGDDAGDDAGEGGGGSVETGDLDTAIVADASDVGDADELEESLRLAEKLASILDAVERLKRRLDAFERQRDEATEQSNLED
jgi:hypothetical protein